MKLEKRIKAFSILGLFLKQFKSEILNSELSELNNKFYNDFNELINKQKALNGWFDRKNVLNAIDAVALMLSHDELIKWADSYSIKEGNKNIGVIMAGNIPLVGFHDFLTVLITGNKIQAKLSSDDNTLLKKIAEIIIDIEPDFADKIEFVEILQDFDAVIATGSNNTSRYFKQYFDNYPNVIRKNRSSIAIVNENDSIDDLKELGKDIFNFYGLGCRSVSKLYVPKGFKLDKVFEALFDYKDVIDNNKYANNYDYNKAVYLLGNHPLLDNNFLLLKEDSSLNSPVGVLHYEYYDDIVKLKSHLNEIQEDIQCVVSSNNTPIQTINFGESQCPMLADYADGVDTLTFINEL